MAEEKALISFQLKSLWCTLHNIHSASANAGAFLQQIGDKNTLLISPMSRVPWNHSNFFHDLIRLHLKVNFLPPLADAYGKATPESLSTNIFGTRQLLSSPRNFTSVCASIKMEEWYLVPPDTKLLEREGQGARERNKLPFPRLTLE